MEHDKAKPVHTTTVQTTGPTAPTPLTIFKSAETVRRPNMILSTAVAAGSFSTAETVHLLLD